MFNRSFNLTAFVKDIPSLALRKAAWLSLVGSVNASLFGAADAVADQLIRDGVIPREFKELERDVLETAVGDRLIPNQRLYRLHTEWRKQLLNSARTIKARRADGAEDDLGSIASTITMMTGTQKMRSIDAKAVGMIKSIGIDITPEMIKEAREKRLMDDNTRAQQRAARVGLIEYIIDQMFASNDSSEANSDEPYTQLDDQVKEHLCNKLTAVLNKAMTDSIQNTLFGRTGDDVLGVGDYVIAQKIIVQLIDLIYVTELQRAPAPTQATSVTETLDNGIKVTRAVA